MGRALGRMISRSLKVVYASRRAEAMVQHGATLAGPILSIQEALEACDSGIVILAVQATQLTAVVDSAAPFLRPDTAWTFVEISNPELSIGERLGFGNAAKMSVAEELQDHLDKMCDAASADRMHVVKAFNNIGAFQAEQGITNGSITTCKMACNNKAAAERVSDVARVMGLLPMLIGKLLVAREMELRQGQFFSEWLVSSIVTLCTLCLWVPYNIIWYCDLDLNFDAAMGGPRPIYSFDQVPLKVMNGITAQTSIVLLSLVYLPGLFTSIYQILRWSASEPIPKWLAVWMNARKYLGLQAFVFAAVHAIISCLIVSSQYYYSLYTFDFVTAEFKYMSVWGEVSMLLGVVAFVLMGCQAVCSIPSVGAAMSYMEWWGVFSLLGWFVLCLATVHNLTYNLSFEHCDLCTKGVKLGLNWPRSATGSVVPPGSWIAFGFGALAIILKMLLTLPPLGAALANIRGESYFGIRVGNPRRKAAPFDFRSQTMVPSRQSTLQGHSRQSTLEDEQVRVAVTGIPGLAPAKSPGDTV
ncbi:hypothetical protein FOA52_012319 [Chlamydomonas sp. UWO 241]|nr:hypothetical protein FOA52_012319 [Chlamydomonas sp. UWO 241]